MSTPKLGSGESKLETAVSWLLIIGVIISLALEVVGIGVYYHTYHEMRVSQDPAVFIHGSNFFTFLYDQFKTGQTGNAAARLMTAGIIILILVPYLRVAISTFFFAREKNYKFVVITLFVLIVLTVALIKH